MLPSATDEIPASPTSTPPDADPRPPRWPLLVAALALVLLVATQSWLTSSPEPVPPAPDPQLAVPTPQQDDAPVPNDDARGGEAVLWSGTFDRDDGGRSWATVFGLVGETASENASVRRAPRGGRGAALRITNDGGGTRGERWGYDARFSFEEAGFESREEAYFRYYVWFPNDYEWDTQGKMPGLQGVVPDGSPWWANNSNGVTCASGRHRGLACHDERQFGARTMWKGDGMITYLNVVRANGTDHNDLRNDGAIYSLSFRYENPDGSPMELRPGWNYVEQHVKLNTPGEDDGIFEGWINGVRGIRLTDVQYRAAGFDDLQISQWNLSHFWGGPPSDYPQEPTEVYYDDFAVSEARIGPR